MSKRKRESEEEHFGLRLASEVSIDHVRLQRWCVGPRMGIDSLYVGCDFELLNLRSEPRMSENDWHFEEGGAESETNLPYGVRGRRPRRRKGHARAGYCAHQ